MYLKEREVVLSNEFWQVAIDVTLMPYEEALSVIKGDLLEIRNHRQEFASESEIGLIGTLLTTLESKLQAFKQILPTLDSRRGLLNIGGSMLKTLFGTAVVSDVTSLRNIIDELQESQKDIIHSVTNQFTYIKKLDPITNVNVEAISNLFRIIKEKVIHSHEKLQQTARDILFLNLTIHGQSTLFTTIRQLEFTFLRFTQQIDELINAVQHIITRKLPLSLVSPLLYLTF